MKTTIHWLNNRTMVGQTGSGHAVVMDGPEQFGGRNLGPRPMEMLLLGLGGCTQFDVLMILEKSRQQVTDLEVRIEAERAETDPKVFTGIHIQFVVTGKSLDEKRVRRAVELSADKYCSASIMLGKTANITHGYEIVEAV